MLTRQKTVLALLEEAGKPLHKTNLVKLLFLLRQETCLKDESTFYDFVPYKYGPFSFALYRELEALQRDGFIVDGGNEIHLSPDAGGLARTKIDTLPETTLDAVSEIHGRYGNLSYHSLLKEVYARYQWFATRSELTNLLPENLPVPSRAEPAVYTSGYQDRSVDAFFDNLLAHGIEVVVDVRANPFSRKYGFAQKSMRDIAVKLGMEYRHFPSLGIPSEQRADLSDEASYFRLFEAYEREILPVRPTEIQDVADLMESRPSVLVCMEREARLCHRGRLANSVSEVSGLPIVHL